MKDLCKTFVRAVHSVSFCGLILCNILGIIYEVIGPVNFERIFSSIGIPNGVKCVYVVSATMLLLLIITHCIKNRL